MLEILEGRIVLNNYTVTNLGDAGVGMGNSGDLRYCINQADMVGLNNTITFQAGLQGKIDLGSTLDIAAPLGNILMLTINNPGGPNAITVDRAANAQGNFSLFQVGPSTSATISGLTITKGNSNKGGAVYVLGGGITLQNCVVSGNTSQTDGGAIYVDLGSKATIDNTIVSGNTALGGNGGAIYQGGDNVFIRNGSTISGNTAKTSGGGIYATAPVSVVQSTISGNTATTGDGGGIWSNSTQTINMITALTISKSTISGNTAQATGKGGAIYNAGLAKVSNSTSNGNTANQGASIFTAAKATSTLNNVTEAGNTAKGAGQAPLKGSLGPLTTSPGIGGGDYVDSGGTESLVNTIIAQNIADISPDVYGIFSSQGYNLIGDGDGASGFLNTDLVGTGAQPINPLLNPLGFYGGPTETMTLQAGSPARAAGNPNAVDDTTDQRGDPRIVNGLVDIGAVEMQPGESVAVKTQTKAVTTTQTAVLLPAGTTTALSPSQGATPASGSVLPDSWIAALWNQFDPAMIDWLMSSYLLLKKDGLAA